jgi:YVTN family beta-propeller protein
VVAGYRIEAVAGQGGMGVVYKAIQLDLQRPVALKLIAPSLLSDANFRERFKREAQLAASIDHPNVIPVHEAGEIDGSLFLAMRYVEGTDLAALIDRDSALEPRRAVRIAAQAAAALDAAHRRGLVHRDVKPANVLIDGDDEHVYLTDFGLTKHATEGAPLTKTGMFVGTLDYCAPEQIRGERSDHRADVYALGCLLFHSLTGRPPFERDSEVAKMYAHLNDAPPAPSDVAPAVPRALDAVVASAMAKDPAGRFASAGELGRAATAALKPGTPAPPATEPGGMSRRRRTALGLALAGLLGTGLVAAVLAAAGILGGEGKQTAEAAGGAAPAPAAEVASEPADQPRPVASIDVGNGPDGLTVDDAGSVWVSNARDDTLTRIDARSGEVIGEPIAAGDDPDGLVAEKGTLWVASAQEDRVLRFETSADAAVPGGTIAVGNLPEGISLGRQLVWVANINSGTVNRIDRASPAVVGAPIGVGSRPTGVFVGPTTVWVTNNGDATVSRIDVSTAEVIGEPIPVGSQPRGVVEASGSVWVANSGDNTVSRLDAATGEPIGDPIKVGRNPRELAFGDGFIWVANNDDNSVTRIDPDTGRVVGTPIPVGNRPIGIAVRDGSVWVANFGDDTVTRIAP